MREAAGPERQLLPDSTSSELPGIRVDSDCKATDQFYWFGAGVYQSGPYSCLSWQSSKPVTPGLSMRGLQGGRGSHKGTPDMGGYQLNEVPVTQAP